MIGVSFVGSTAATRMWRVFKAAGRPWPRLDEDDVIDYMIMEAVCLKVNKDDENQEKEQEKKEWMKDKSGLDNLREVAG